MEFPKRPGETASGCASSPAGETRKDTKAPEQDIRQGQLHVKGGVNIILKQVRCVADGRVGEVGLPKTFGG